VLSAHTQQARRRQLLVTWSSTARQHGGRWRWFEGCLSHPGCRRGTDLSVFAVCCALWTHRPAVHEHGVAGRDVRGAPSKHRGEFFGSGIKQPQAYLYRVAGTCFSFYFNSGHGKEE